MTAQHQGPATYFDGTTAARHAVMLTIGDTALAIASAEGAPLAHWDYPAIESLPAPADRLRLGLSDGSSTARIDVRDPAFAQAIKDRLGLGTPLYQARERRRRRLVIAWSAAAVAAVLVIGVTGLPAIAAFLTPFVPHSWEVRAGASAHDFQVTQFSEQRPFECGNEGEMERTGRVAFLKGFRKLEAAANLPIPVHPFVVRTAVNNATALPGGYIHINMGFIDNVQSPDEFFGVIGHELGHVAHRHSLTGTLHTVGLAYLFGLALGDVFGSGAVMLAAHNILNNRNTRGQEAQADAFGAQLMAKVGGDSHRFSDWFERMSKKGGQEFARILSTHPSDAARIAAIRASPKVANPVAIITEAEWQALKQICSRQ